ncbi:MAG: NAD-dependent epimerase/dehydratase family protein, partial [Acidobacteria bacterium]|nr:NAD-dependent epimerase/dehydratase family protein [Acidobacteriota bacterium]MDW7984749.1 NAD-dependent epimerase/dehydratase family protein [Acidobacteriota bacterium]
MEHVRVTGAPGWLGTRLVELLTHGGAYPDQPQPSRVTCLVQPGRDPGPLTAWGVRVVVGDVRDRTALQEALRGVDTVFHLAGRIHPRRIRDLYEVNTHRMQATLEEAVRAGVRRFVYGSSTSPAGLKPHLDHTFTEDDPPRPYMHYGRSKWLAEQAVLEATQTGHIEGVVIRPCWFYGPGQPEPQ